MDEVDRTSELSWKNSGDLITWDLQSSSTQQRSTCQRDDLECSSWLEEPSGQLVVWSHHKGWRSVSLGTTLDASYSKGPDNHGQRTVVLLDQPEVATGS
jgi:hypothetical protein